MKNAILKLITTVAVGLVITACGIAENYPAHALAIMFAGGGWLLAFGYANSEDYADVKRSYSR